MTSSITEVTVLPSQDLPDAFRNRPDAYEKFTFHAFRKRRDGSHQFVSATANASVDSKSRSSIAATIHGSRKEVDLLAEPGPGLGEHRLLKLKYGRIAQGKSFLELQAAFKKTRHTSIKKDLVVCALQYELQTQVLNYDDDDQEEEATAGAKEKEEEAPLPREDGDALNDMGTPTANNNENEQVESLHQQIDSYLCQRLAAATIVNLTVNNINNTTVNNDNSNNTTVNNDNSNTSNVVNNINTTNFTTRRSQSWD